MLVSDDIRSRVEGVLGFCPDDWRAVDRGYTAAKRFVVRKGARSAFIKIGTTPLTARMLNREIDVYQSLAGPFMPRVLGWNVDEPAPIIALEDLSSALWPPPWSAEVVALVLEQIGNMHRASGALERRTLLYDDRRAGWPAVARSSAVSFPKGCIVGLA